MSDIIKKASKIAGSLEKKAVRAGSHARDRAAMQASAAREALGEKAVELAASAGDFFERRVGETLEGSRFEAPILEGEPKPIVWYRIPIENAMAGDGSDFHIYIKKGTSDRNLCIFFSGGGVAWNEKMAKKPVTGGRVAAWKPNYYWNNLRPFTQIMNINVGITDLHDINPFYDWNFAVITYATGDFHIGSADFRYSDEEGQKVLHFCGHDNFILSMEKIKSFFPSTKRLLIAGDSAGAFATPALAPEIIEDYYPEALDITLFSDSALLLRTGWKSTIRDMWRAPEAIAEPIYTDNITADWYEHITKMYGNRCRYLYASSIHDYLLSAFINEEMMGEYFTDEETQRQYEKELRDMVRRMRGYDEPVHCFIYDYRMPQLFGRGGTIHTAVRSPHFFVKHREGFTMAEWLFKAVKGNPHSVGLAMV